MRRERMRERGEEWEGRECGRQERREDKEEERIKIGREGEGREMET